MIHSRSAFRETSANMQNTALCGAKQLFNAAINVYIFKVAKGKG